MNGCIRIDGREYPLHFTVNHICAMEETVGTGLAGLMQGGILGIRALFWCGLMDEKITLEEAGGLMQRYLETGGTVGALSAALARAMEDAGFFHIPAAKKD